MPRAAFTAFLVLATIGLAVLKAATTYADLPAVAAYPRSFGFAAVPWLVGLVVATIAALAGRRRPQKGRFRDSLEGAALVMLLILYALALFRPG